MVTTRKPACSHQTSEHNSLNAGVATKEGFAPTITYGCVHDRTGIRAEQRFELRTVVQRTRELRTANTHSSLLTDESHGVRA